MQAIWQAIETSQIAIILFGLNLVGVFLTILMENRNPAKSLAYIILLIFLPVIGLIIYYFVGRDLRKNQIFKKNVFKENAMAEKYIEGHYIASGLSLKALHTDIGYLAQPFALLHNQNQSMVHVGNKLVVLNNGEEKFPALFEAMLNAKKHIHLEYYIFSKDDIGSRITEILLQKLSEGVQVRFIYDDRGSTGIKDIPKVLEKAGAEVYGFMPVRFTSLAQANYRDHRKIVIIDGLIGFVGGINADDRYLNNGKHPLYWRDTHVMIEGSAVLELQYRFFQNLSFVAKKQYELSEGYFPTPIVHPSGGTVSIAASGPASAFPYNMESMLVAITLAKKSIKICTPYFIPSDQIISALGVAAAVGVDVELIIPANSDSLVVKHSSYSYLQPLLARGVKIYLYQKGFIHAKTMLVDDALGMIGTVNMDIRSFYINFEIAALFHDEIACNDMKKSFDDDKSNSILVDSQKWENRPKYAKFFDSVCRLLTPLL